jgi:adenosylmethionine-8-amino-7-oxononanoate aminotransferase
LTFAAREIEPVESPSPGGRGKGEGETHLKRGGCSATTPQVFFAPSPYSYRCPFGKDKEDCGLLCLEEMEKILAENCDEIAALIIEPLVQGAGGMIVHPQGYLKGVRELCTKYNALLIADEVLTGFGRTGRMFACEHEGVVPDILCISKGLTGGYLPLAATLATEEIFNAFLGDYNRTFFHGHTYTGNPLACAAALASLEVFEKESVIKNLQLKIEFFQQRLQDFYSLEHVGDVRQCGMIAGIELVKDRQIKEPYPPQERIGCRVILEARKRGALLRPLGDIIVIMPPLSINMEQLKRLSNVVWESIKGVTESRQ